MNYLISRQQPDGSWGSEMQATYKIGVTSLCVLSLIESGLTADDPAVARFDLAAERQGTESTTDLKSPDDHGGATAAKEGVKDNLRLFALAQRLEQGQVKGGPEPGGWDYTCTGGGGAGQPDRSNTQYAILGLRRGGLREASRSIGKPGNESASISRIFRRPMEAGPIVPGRVPLAA
ncbi:MAG: hypothetical protein R3C12_11430 [Planctomycetaceae bacterium]